MNIVVGNSIGQVETRHNSYLNGAIGRDEFPTAYQLSLTPTQGKVTERNGLRVYSCTA